MLSRVRRASWLVFPLAVWGLILLILGVISVNPVLLFASAGCSGMIFWLAVAPPPTDRVRVKPKPSLQVPAPFGIGPVDWNSISALELAMYGETFPARLYRRRPDVLISSERGARQWITGQVPACRPRDEMIFASEPGIDPEDDEWWNLFRLPGYSAPDAGKPTSSFTEPSSGAPNAFTSPPAANRKCNGWAVSGPCDCVKHERAARNNRTLTAKEAAYICPEAIVPGNEHRRAMPLREYVRYFPNAVWTPSEYALRRLENHAGTSSRNLRLPDDAFPAASEGDNTRSLFNRLLRRAAQIGQMLESLERDGDVNTKTYGNLVREQRRVINQAKSLFPALADEDRKRGPAVLPGGTEITPLRVETEMLPYSYRIPDSGGEGAYLVQGRGHHAPRPVRDDSFTRTSNNDHEPEGRKCGQG